MQRKGVRFEGDEEDNEDYEFDSNLSNDEYNSTMPDKSDPHFDERFEKTLEEYGSDDLGDLEDEVIIESNKNI